MSDRDSKMCPSPGAGEVLFRANLYHSGLGLFAS
jgi:hypothetical protein